MKRLSVGPSHLDEYRQHRKVAEPTAATTGSAGFAKDLLYRLTRRSYDAATRLDSRKSGRFGTVDTRAESLAQRRQGSTSLAPAWNQTAASNVLETWDGIAAIALRRADSRARQCVRPPAHRHPVLH